MSNQEQVGDVIKGVIRGNTGQAAIGKNITQTQGAPQAVNPQDLEQVIAQLRQAFEADTSLPEYVRNDGTAALTLIEAEASKAPEEQDTNKIGYFAQRLVTAASGATVLATLADTVLKIATGHP